MEGHILPVRIKTYVSGTFILPIVELLSVTHIRHTHNTFFRRERNTCRICWSTTVAQGDFELSTGNTEMGGDAVGTGKFEAGCCNYGSKNTMMTGYDCAKIPQPSKATDSAALNAVVNGFCGGELATAGAAVETTVCCKQAFFFLSYFISHFETTLCFQPNKFHFIFDF